MQGEGAHPGLTPRAIDEMFGLIQDMDNYEINLKCYMVELYLDALADLLVPKGQPRDNLDIKEQSNGMVYVAGAYEREIHSVEEANRIFNYGLGARKTGSTAMNA